jgi:hypothetical protein
MPKPIVGEWQALRVALQEAEPAGVFGSRTRAPRVQHFRRDIADHAARAVPRLRQEAPRDVAGTAGHVEEQIGGLAFRSAQPADQLVLPKPVQPAGHQIVHQIVARCDAREDAVDHALLFVLADGGETEPGTPLLRARRGCAAGCLL